MDVQPFGSGPGEVLCVTAQTGSARPAIVRYWMPCIAAVDVSHGQASGSWPLLTEHRAGKAESTYP